ncbi:Cut9-interacting protein scn1 [Didymosphaeria variabile]|uniref:Cut9-interacting protein scn1 n=1 Tax=Didymosphaeria variabile TaxID=1932322 RepID=A0A9W9CB62_9PLEO|nr:Cut9-interacting protein scn1 [Didymosphaeria variabile]KAJ4353585.1 Cut9-interacting protein scn1 [Didymosphaeria variabile]
MSTHQNDFPWHIGVYDAHCHPTDIMSSIPSIPSMKARCLTVMGTRAQDQDLVSQVADQYGIKSNKPEEWKREECMVPCFGWHPWFAHMMYLDHPSGSENGTGEREETVLRDEDKIKHYQNVLAPKREYPSEEDRQTYLSLPNPRPFSAFLSQTRSNLEKYPLALVGEIGLDRSFRIPEAFQSGREENDLTPGGREGRRLTPFRCAPAHQKEIFKRQLMLASEMNRAVSVHGVQAHGLVFDTIKELWKDHQLPVLSKREKKKRGKDDPSVEAQLASSQTGDGKAKPYPPRVCLHSYSGSADAFKQYLNPAIPVAFFASFSTAINLGDAVGEETPQSFVDMISTVPDDMVLVESDLHTAGNEMDRRLEDIVRRICKIKGWGLEEGAERLGKNWRRFVFGTEG